MAHPGFGEGGAPTGSVGALPPAATNFGGFWKKNTHFSVVFCRILSGLNPPLLALLVDLRYSFSIFVYRLVVTKNISGGGGDNCFFCPPGYAPGDNDTILLRITGMNNQFKFDSGLGNTKFASLLGIRKLSSILSRVRIAPVETLSSSSSLRSKLLT